MHHSKESPLYSTFPSVQNYFFGEFTPFDREMFVETATSFRPNEKINSSKDAVELFLEILREPSQKFIQLNMEFPKDCNASTRISEKYDYMIPRMGFRKSSDFPNLLLEIVTAMKEYANQAKQVELTKIEAFNQKMDDFLHQNNIVKKKKYSIEPTEIRVLIDQPFFGAFEHSSDLVKAQIIEELRQKFLKTDSQPEKLKTLFNLQSQKWTSAQFKDAIEYLISEDRSFKALFESFDNYTYKTIEINEDFQSAFGKASEALQLTSKDSIMTEYKKRILRILNYYRIYYRHEHSYFYHQWNRHFPGLMQKPVPEIYEEEENVWKPKIFTQPQKPGIHEDESVFLVFSFVFLVIAAFAAKSLVPFLRVLKDNPISAF